MNAWRVAAAVLILPLCASAAPWFAEGPGPNTDGQVEGIADGEVVGAINSVAPHPTDPEVIYVGAGNGGIWRTDNATVATPLWTQQTDGQQSLSIGSVEFDPTDPTSDTLIAGIGRFSSIGRRGGQRTGLLYTTDGGDNWQAIDGSGALIGCNIKGVAARGNVLMFAADGNDGSATLCNSLGVFRSTDGGDTWLQQPVSGTATDLQGDPSNPAILYALVVAGANPGIYKSTDTGATFNPVGDASVNGSLASAGNAEMSVGASDNLFVISWVGGQTSQVFHSPNGGMTWVQMDNPVVSPNTLHPGGQGSIHLSIAADRTNANIVYAGGDRQNFPNSISAFDFSGNLMRGDVSQASGSQWVHLTHSSSSGPAGGGTANRTAPHADSRDMAMAADGTLIESDDGGVYRRTSPLDDTGDWETINGNLQSTEFHGNAYDPVSGVIVGGTQDTGTPEQINPMDPRWRSRTTADGGDTAAAALSTPGMSIRYTSTQFLGGFRRRIFDASNNQVSSAGVNTSGISAAFYSPIRINAVNSERLIVGGFSGVFESPDRGDTFNMISGQTINSVGEHPIAYGTSDNEDALYIGSVNDVYIRTGAPPASLDQSQNYPGGTTVVDISMDPDDHTEAFVADTGRVFRTTNAGQNWTEITGNLASLGGGTISSMTFAKSVSGELVIVGTLRGVFAASAADGFLDWKQLGDTLPNAPVYDLSFDVDEDLLVAALLGRGSWTMVNPNDTLGLPFFADSFESP